MAGTTTRRAKSREITLSGSAVRVRGFKAQLYLSERPDSQVQFIEYLRSGHWLLVLVGSATAAQGRRKHPGMYFIIVEPSGDCFSRVGVLVIRKDFATFRESIVFGERAIRVI